MDPITRRNIIVLFIYQSISGAQLPILFVIAGLVGKNLSPISCFATLPISCIILGSMLSASRISAIMARYGRFAGFVVGNICGGIGGILGALALIFGRFELLLLGSLFSGTALSSGLMSRFAAADNASEDYKARAISIVMSAGLIAAIFGPFLVKNFTDRFAISFLGDYLAIIALNIVGIFVCSFLYVGNQKSQKVAKDDGRSIKELLRTPAIYVAIITGMVAYALMNLVMTATPLAVVGCGFATSDAANVVSAHVLGMYAPSFFTGYLISYFGVRKIIGSGLLLLACAGFIALSGFEIWNFYLALILLGVGWNFGFIGATALLASSHSNAERARIQGMNDTIVFGFVMIASFASGGLMNCVGGNVVSGWKAVNYAMVPFLILAFAALISLRNMPRTKRKTPLGSAQ